MRYEEFFRNKKKIKVLARLVAHLMGDGCVTERYFAYFNKNKILLENYEKDLRYLFGNIHIIKGKHKSGVFLLQVQNKEILSFLKLCLFDYRSNFIKFPEFVKNKESKIEFLKSIFDDEGCVALRVFNKTGELKRNITLSSNSLRFLEEIKLVLEKDFDIMSNRIIRYLKTKDKKRFINYVLSITGRKNFQKFKDEIGFYHPEKREKLDRMLSSYIRKA